MGYKELYSEIKLETTDKLIKFLKEWGVKIRRELKVGDKVRFRDEYGEVLVGVIKQQITTLGYLVVVKGVTSTPSYMHRRQVISVFKKKEKPLIVWTNDVQLDYASKNSGAICGSKSYSWNIPLRPLTKKERLRWGV
jgi:hypothetical protein